VFFSGAIAVNSETKTKPYFFPCFFFASHPRLAVVASSLLAFQLAFSLPANAAPAAPAGAAVQQAATDTDAAAPGRAMVSGSCARAAVSVLKSIPSLEITGIRESTMPGMCELVMGSNIAYVSADKPDFMFVGRIINLKSFQDETEERLSEIMQNSGSTENAADPGVRKNKKNEWTLSEIPLEIGLMSGTRGGARVVAFIDPDCPYSRQLVTFLESKEIKSKVEVTYMPLPMESVHPGSRGRMAAILCDKKPLSFMIDVMKGGKPVPTDGIKKSCKKDMDDRLSLIYQFAVDRGLSGTPFMVRADGEVLLGFQEMGLVEWIRKGDPERVNPDIPSALEAGAGQIVSQPN